jgi:HNH endonuclease
MPGPKPIAPIVRFEKKFRKKGADECWLWQAALKGQKGNEYGHFSMPPGMGAHRASWILYIGEIPPGTHVLHKCDNRLCVNPSHLFLGNPKINSDDCHTKGRGPVATQFKPKLSDELVAEIRRLYKPGEIGYLKLAKRFDVSPGHIRQLIKGSRRKTSQNQKTK